MAGHVHKLKQTKGFSLIELAVTLLLMSSSIIALLALQFSSMRISQDSLLYTRAQILLDDMSERLKTNSLQAQLTNDYLTEFSKIGSIDHTCEKHFCTAAMLAHYDLNNWQAALHAQLPKGRGKIIKLNNRFTITVSYQNKKANWIYINAEIKLAAL